MKEPILKTDHHYQSETYGKWEHIERTILKVHERSHTTEKIKLVTSVLLEEDA